MSNLKSLKTNGLIILIKDDKQVVQVINEIAPEHLEMNVKNKTPIKRVNEFNIYSIKKVCLRISK